jgi:hypothetical protein
VAPIHWNSLLDVNRYANCPHSVSNRTGLQPCGPYGKKGQNAWPSMQKIIFYCISRWIEPTLESPFQNNPMLYTVWNRFNSTFEPLCSNTVAGLIVWNSMLRYLMTYIWNTMESGIYNSSDENVPTIQLLYGRAPPVLYCLIFFTRRIVGMLKNFGRSRYSILLPEEIHPSLAEPDCR